MMTLLALRNLLSGFKTYIVGFTMIAVAVMEGWLGWDIPNVEVGPDWFGMVLEGIAVMTLRSGISKATTGRVIMDELRGKMK